MFDVTSTLNDKEIIFVSYYVSTLKAKQNRQTNDIKADTNLGKILYQKKCSSCHLDNAKGNKKTKNSSSKLASRLVST